MSETPRELANIIVEGKEAWTDRDAVTVSAAYLELVDALVNCWLLTAHQAPVRYRVSDRDAQQNADQHDIQTGLK